MTCARFRFSLETRNFSKVEITASFPGLKWIAPDIGLLRPLSYDIPSCNVHTCDYRFITRFAVLCIHTCELNANPLSWMQSHNVGPNQGPTHTRAQQHTSFVSISYAYTTWQILFSSFLRQDNADRTERNVFEAL